MVSASSKATNKNFLNRFFEFNSLRETIFIDELHFANKVAFMDLYIFRTKMTTLDKRLKCMAQVF